MNNIFSCSLVFILSHCSGKYTNEDQDDESEVTVLSIVVGDEESPTTCVLLTEYGDVQDYQSYDFMKTKVSARNVDGGSRYFGGVDGCLETNIVYRLCFNNLIWW